MKNLPVILPLILLISIHCCAQGEFNKWYLGYYSALDFNSGSPVAIPGNVCYNWDNIATVSDACGNLLFYCDGTKVYDKNNLVMPNGSGLLGSLTGGHSATVVEQPDSNQVYYLFTMDSWGGPLGLHYSVVDMRLRGGLGDVTTTKNILVMTPCTEKIIPIRHSNGKDIWILIHEMNSNNFRAYTLSATGFSITPILSSVGSNPGPDINAAGEITVNRSNNKIALASYGSGIYELFDFNNNTGKVSNPITLDGFASAWGLEFSPDGSKLYSTCLLDNPVYQFDLSNYTKPAIAASKTIVGNIVNSNSNGYITGYLSLGPDNKIYCGKYSSPYIASITNPNSLGITCGFIDEAVDLVYGTSSVGLVDKILVNPTFASSLVISPDTIICEGTVAKLNVTGGKNYSWTPSEGLSCTNCSNPIVSPTVSTTYHVTVANGGCSATDSVIISLSPNPKVFVSGNFLICNGETTTLNGNGADTYTWIPSIGLSAIDGTSVNASPSIAVTYTITGIDVTGCSANTTVEINVLPSPVINLESSISIPCGSSGVRLTSEITGASSFHWLSASGMLQKDTTSLSPLVNPEQTTTYTLMATTGQCETQASVVVLLEDASVFIPNAFSPNGDGLNEVYKLISLCGFQLEYFRIYNRWGEKIFETTYINSGWNGTFKGEPQEAGAYVYVVSGHSDVGKEVFIKGNVTLLR